MSPDFPTVRSAPRFLQLSPFSVPKFATFLRLENLGLSSPKFLAAETSLMKKLCSRPLWEEPHHSLEHESRAVFPPLCLP